MALIPIPSQPIQLKPFVETRPNCYDEGMCMIYDKESDTVRVQMIQTPCETNILCNPGFETSGTNMVLNGEFETNMDEWEGSENWNVVDERAILNSDANINHLFQNIGAVEGQSYNVRFTICDLGTEDSIEVSLNQGDPFIVTAPGVYSITLVAGALTGYGIRFSTISGDIEDPNVEACLDSVFVQDAQNTACWDLGTGWTTGEGQACHTPVAGTGELRQEIDFDLLPLAGRYFNLKYSVIGQTAGTLVVGAGGATQRAVEANGTYDDYFTIEPVTENAIVFYATPDFDGCLRISGLWQLYAVDDFPVGTARLLDSEGLPVIDSLTISIDDDRINISTVLTTLTDGACYSIEVTDRCTQDVMTSNCIKVLSDTSAYHVMVGVNSSSYALGFKFSFAFSLFLRLKLHFLQPSRPINQANSLFATGIKRKIYSQVDKKWLLTFEAVDENTHDTIAVILASQAFAIGTSLLNLKTYICNEKEYSGDFGENSERALGEGQVEISLASGVVFYQNL